MTKDHALLVLTQHIIECGMLMPMDWLKTHGDGSEFMEAYNMAMDALKGEFVVKRQCVHRLRAEVRIPEKLKTANPEEATKFAMSKLRQGLADGLLDYMKCTTQHDPMNMCQIIRGEVRVVDPSFDY